jgi:hypothetical protein
MTSESDLQTYNSPLISICEVENQEKKTIFDALPFLMKKTKESNETNSMHGTDNGFNGVIPHDTIFDERTGVVHGYSCIKAVKSSMDPMTTNKKRKVSTRLLLTILENKIRYKRIKW